MKLFLRGSHLLFVLFLLVQLLPDARPSQAIYSVGFAVAAETASLLFAVLTLRTQRREAHLFFDLLAFVYASLIVWELLTAKFSILRAALFPPPGMIIAQIASDAGKITLNIRSSLGIILEGHALGLAAGIPLGLFLGWSARLGSVAAYVSKFLGSIPPVVYIPYGIALLPTFRSVSVLVIFLATFWPVLAGTMSGVLNVERRIIDSARVLNVSRFSMLFHIILPASLPQIFIGCNQGLSVSFVLLTSAEMIGARSGMGYYVKNYSDLGDYTRTVAGVLVIGTVVSTVMFFSNKLQNYLLRWKS
ncbi:MAG: ABC transporter permease subunit [Synergistaceae bacterium]|jgi:NitT/TauT family transport system permease protein|nr:ABC transporter permease subunit [Synergistaceae bacterium]